LPSNAPVPLQYLSGAGIKAAPVVPLTWGVLAVSVIVIVIIALLLAGAIWHRPGVSFRLGDKTMLGPEEGGMRWLWWGVGLSAMALFFTTVWTMVVLARIAAPPSKPNITIEVTGRQWWWQARYLDKDGRSFATANEIHIPAGEPVRLQLIGGDVIHSFWVPQLGGKMDTIPGQTNETWLEADKPGIYRGQCTEYCGAQHARMGVIVVAEAPADFRAWRDHQLAAAAPAPQVFLQNCGGCHTVRGTKAAGSMGPDLSHLMTRSTLASVTLPNNHADLGRWIRDPQGIKPGNLMPDLKLSPAQWNDIQAYLESLT
jgi:cytochrome c oxidase subunit 2